MVFSANIIRWPIERAPFWLAYKVPPIRMAALGISKLTERMLPRGYYTSGLSMAAYFHYKDVQKGRSRQEIEVTVIAGKGKKAYSALLAHRLSTPREIARMLRIVVRTTREFSLRHGDPEIYFTRLLPQIMSMAGDIEQLKEYTQELMKLVDNYHQNNKDEKTGKCPTLTFYLHVLVLMVPGAKKVVQGLIQGKKITAESAIKAYFKALDEKASLVLTPPSYYQQKDGSSPYLEKLIAPLLNVVRSGADLVAWVGEFKDRINAFGAKYQPEPPLAYAKFLVYLAVKIMHFGRFKEAAGKIDNLLDDYHAMYGKHVKTYSVYLEAVFQALKKSAEPTDAAFVLLESWDKAIKWALYIYMDGQIKQRAAKISQLESQGIAHVKAAEQTLYKLQDNFHGFLSEVVAEMIKHAETPLQFREKIQERFPDFRPPVKPAEPGPNPIPADPALPSDKPRSDRGRQGKKDKP